MLFTVVLLGCWSWAQPTSVIALTIPRVTNVPKIDDFFSMASMEQWREKLAVIQDFRQSRPLNGAPSTERTTAYLGYDSKNLYVVFVCIEDARKIRAHFTTRDNISSDDYVAVWIDTFHERHRMYEFQVNPLGVQRDGIDDETARKEDFTFDTIWASRGKITRDGYVVWISIPFKSLRFPEHRSQTWGVLLERDITWNFEKTFWPAIAEDVSGMAVQSADLTGIENISPEQHVQFTPYGLFRSFRGLDLRNPAAPRFTDSTGTMDGGLDSKVVIKNAFVLDLTINPDFSQIESDQPQVTVSQRFEVFFPEKRPFFIENAGYFATPINLFFSRRIVDPQFGARLTGRMGRYSVGALIADDRSPGESVPDDNPVAGKRATFAIFRAARDVLRDSTLGMIYTDREFDGSSNHVGGFDGRIRLSKDTITSFQAVESSTTNLDGTRQAGPAFEFDLSKSTQFLYANLHYTGRSDGFRTLPGFDPRPDIHAMVALLGYNFWPRNSRYIQSWGPELNPYGIRDHEGNWLNSGVTPTLNFQFQHQTRASIGYAEEAETLRPRDFRALTHNVDFLRHTMFVQMSNAVSKEATISVDYQWGRRVNYSPGVNTPPYLARHNSFHLEMALHPFERLEIDHTYLWFRLGGLETRAPAFNNHILRSKWNWQFIRELAARVILQYNAVIANPLWTSLPPAKNVNADFLISYVLHPGAAVHVGYNSNLDNYDRGLMRNPNNNLIHTRSSFINDNRELFVKISYVLGF